MSIALHSSGAGRAAFPYRDWVVRATVVGAMLPAVLLASATHSLLAQKAAAAESVEKPADLKPRPLRALIVTGGSGHDFTAQKDILKQGLEARACVEVTALEQGGAKADSKIPLYENADWAKGYDIVIHDECFADVRDVDWVQRILKPHRAGLPAVVLHSAVHSYQNGSDAWFEFCGVTSRRHGAAYGHEVLNADGAHPIMRGFSAGWFDPSGELFWIEKVWPTAHALASAKNRERGNEEVCAWTNQYHGARVFGTTLGHHNDTIASGQYLDLLARGVLWACDKLTDDYLKGPRPAGTAKAIGARADAAPESKADRLARSLKAPDGFDLTVFAASPAVEYPVYVAAAPDGTVYVSVDKNGSLDRKPFRGAVYRLRDIDGDGRADESKLFVPDVDSPRGLVWDRDRLYLMHPPNLSAFIDNDGDGRADEERVLVKNIAFGFKDRPADHTSNGVTLGVDGWLYLAIGDFGFMRAEGADGRTLEFRGGGVVRVRPDGSGLELYSRGTRNILEVALDGLLDGFARDNTNDGGGWDIRLHHFTGLEDHGYPRLFKNFNDEIIQPLADYGGGSGCGAMYLDEPGFPAGASPAAYTADWGREIAFRHRMEPNGATFKADQNPFLRLSRITDLDADANSHIYASSWDGAKFTYAGEDVGYVVRLTPKDFKAPPLPDIAKAGEQELLAQFRSTSGRRRLAAQRELLSRGPSPAAVESLNTMAADASEPLTTRVLALFALKQSLGAASHARLAKLAEDPALRPLAIRAIADRWDQLKKIPAVTLLAGLADPAPRTRLESLVALARWGDAGRDIAPSRAMAMTPVLADSDPVVAHTAVQSLTMLRAADACFAVVDRAAGDRAEASPAARVGALRVLQSLHEPSVVDGLLTRLSRETNVERRQGLIVAVCRLYNREGPWTGASWGTRPDTRGPYYQPETWSESPKIAAALRQVIDTAPQSPETAFLLRQMDRHRVRLDGLLELVLRSAQDDPAFVPQLIGELRKETAVPASALPMLKKAIRSPDTGKETIEQLVVLLAPVDDADAFQAVLDAVPRLSSPRDKKFIGDAKAAFLAPAVLARNVDALAARAARLDGPASIWADAGLLTLAAHKDTSPEVRALANKSLDEGATAPERRAQILRAALIANDRSFEAKALAAAGDPDRQVAAAAKEVIATWKLEKKRGAGGPLIATLKPDDVLEAVINKTKGDPARGEQLFLKLNCNKCHTVKADEPLRGPFLPQVARTYKRNQLAEAVLLPSKTIAQGFVTTVFVLDDGRTVTGFVTNEAADEVTLRDAEAREMKIPTARIEEQAKTTVSMMPEGLIKDLTVEEFASLVSYLESLAALAGK